MMDAALRELVRQRAGGRCEYCRLHEDFFEVSFHVEHITPRQHGGADVPENLALACPECNLLKGPNLSGGDPETHQVERLFHRRRDTWLHHFAYDGPLIIGKTPVGRATVSLLRMNDAGRMRLRDMLLGLE